MVSQPSRLTQQDATRFQAKLGHDHEERAVTEPQRPTAIDPGHRHRGQLLLEVPRRSARFQSASSSPRLTAVGEGRVTGRAIVDLDAVRTQKKRGWTDPLGYLSGTLPLTASGMLTTQNGVGRFQLESAEISGVTDSEVAAAGAPQLLLAHARRTPPASTWTTRSSCPRASARSASAGHRDNRAIDDPVNVQC